MILRASDSTERVGERERERERESYQDSSSSQLCMAVLAGPAGRTLRTLSSAQHTDMTISLSLSLTEITGNRNARPPAAGSG